MDNPQRLAPVEMAGLRAAWRERYGTTSWISDDGLIHHRSAPPFPWRSLVFFSVAGLLVTLPLAIFFSFLPLPLAVLGFLGLVSLSTLLFCALSREF